MMHFIAFSMPFSNAAGCKQSVLSSNFSLSAAAVVLLHNVGIHLLCDDDVSVTNQICSIKAAICLHPLATLDKYVLHIAIVICH